MCTDSYVAEGLEASVPEQQSRTAAYGHSLPRLRFSAAFSACFRVTRSILARLGTGDDLEGNASSFLLEMRDTASILSKADDSSLVLIDELGRGTSNEGEDWPIHCSCLYNFGVH